MAPPVIGAADRCGSILPRIGIMIQPQNVVAMAFYRVTITFHEVSIVMLAYPFHYQTDYCTVYAINSEAKGKTITSLGLTRGLFETSCCIPTVSPSLIGLADVVVANR